MTHEHCDDYVRDKTQPKALRRFLLFNRIPATWSLKWLKRGWPEPVLFATYERKRVRIVMASRFGDVGITKDLEAKHGYETRVELKVLSEFSETSN